MYYINAYYFSIQYATSTGGVQSQRWVRRFLEESFSRVRAVSYTHLDVYKRQVSQNFVTALVIRAQ